MAEPNQNNGEPLRETPSASPAKLLPKVADRRHNFTVIFASIAAVASLISAGLGYEALTLNREFNIAAQQAYLTVRNPQMEVMEETLRGGKVTNLVFTIELYNAGNTPATNVFAKQTAFFGLSDSSPATNPKELELLTRVDLIGPKDAAQIRQIIHVSAVYASNKKFLNSVLLRGAVDYQTRFTIATEMFEWCRNYDQTGGFRACSLSYIAPLK